MHRSLAPLLALLVACGPEVAPPDAVEGETETGSADIEPAPAAFAHGLADRLDQADAVIHGTVVGIDYRVAEDRGPTTLALPHSFVTVQVHEDLIGETGDTVVLRFLGGPKDGRVLRASHVPVVDVGDEIVAVVGRNGRSATPIVGGQAGLVRVSDGLAYSADGAELFVEEGGLRRGNVVESEEAHAFQIGDQRIVDDGLASDGRIRSPGAMPVAELVEWLRDEVGDRHTAGVTSVDPDAPFVIEAQLAKPTVQHAPPIVPLDDEEAALIANDFDPILSTSSERTDR